MAEEIRYGNGSGAAGATRPMAAYYEPSTAASVGGFPALRRVSWGAIFAGAVVGLVVTLLLSLLGIAIGASTVDPLSEQNPVAGLGIGSGIWWIVSSMIGLFIGGWAAARLAGNPRRFDSTLHGVVTWGVATIVTFLLLTTVVGRIIGGAVNVVGEGLSAIGQGAAVATGQLADLAAQEGQVQQQTQQQILGEAEALGPQGQEQLETAVLALLDGQITEQDRAAVIQVLTTQTGLEQAEATRLVNQWEQRIEQTTAQFQQVQDQLLAQTRQASAQVADAVTDGALWAFFGLLLTLGAAAAGGWFGRPKDMPSSVSATAQDVRH